MERRTRLPEMKKSEKTMAFKNSEASSCFSPGQRGLRVIASRKKDFSLFIYIIIIFYTETFIITLFPMPCRQRDGGERTGMRAGGLRPACAGQQKNAQDQVANEGEQRVFHGGVLCIVF